MTKFYCPENTEELLFDTTPDPLRVEIRTIPEMVYCPVCETHHKLTECVVVNEGFTLP